METEHVTIALTVAQWEAVLNALGHAPYIIVNSVSNIVAHMQEQANPQIAEIQKAAAEAALKEATAEADQD